MDARTKMKEAFAQTSGGLFSEVQKADVGGAYLEMGKQGVALLGWADPFYPDPAIPENVKKALIESIESGFPAHYIPPVGDEELKKVIAKKLHDFNKLDVDYFRNIIITPGSDSGLFFALVPFIAPGDDVLIVDPSYPNNFQAVKLLGGNPIHVPAYEENRFEPLIEDFETRLTAKTKAIVLTNPNNPTTTVYRRPFLEKLAAFAIKNDLICIVDQAFEDSVFDGVEFVTLAALPGMFERTVTVFSVSKGMALSGFRVGYIVADDKVMDVLHGVAVSIIGATHTASQIAVTEAFKNPSFIQKYIEIYDKRRHMAFDIFNSVPGVSMLMPESGFYCWVNVSRLGTGDEIAAGLMENRIAMVNGGGNYGTIGKGYIRIIHGSLGSDEQVEKALTRIADYLRGLAEAKGIK